MPREARNSSALDRRQAHRRHRKGDALMSPSIDEQIYKIAKGSLRSSGGVAYAEFKRTLRPRYFVVWRDILLGHLALAGIVAALI